MKTSVFIAVSVCSCQVYPSEYAYHMNSVYRTERSSANCRNYPSGPNVNENYVHCDGTPLRLTDSDIGSEQYNTSDYYLWTAELRNTQLLFIFPTRVNLTTIALHYYSSSNRGLPGLRFWSVPDDFDIWDRGVDTILELGGLSQRWGEKCARAKIFDHTHQYVNMPTYRAYLL